MSEFHDECERLRDSLIESLGIPSSVLDGKSSYSSSQANLAAFEKMMKVKMIGIEFALNMMLDPVFEEGRQAIEEYIQKQVKEALRRSAESN